MSIENFVKAFSAGKEATDAFFKSDEYQNMFRVVNLYEVIKRRHTQQKRVAIDKLLVEFGTSANTKRYLACHRGVTGQNAATLWLKENLRKFLDTFYVFDWEKNSILAKLLSSQQLSVQTTTDGMYYVSIDYSLFKGSITYRDMGMEALFVVMGQDFYLSLYPENDKDEEDENHPATWKMHIDVRYDKSANSNKNKEVVDELIQLMDDDKNSDHGYISDEELEHLTCYSNDYEFLDVIHEMHKRYRESPIWITQQSVFAFIICNQRLEIFPKEIERKISEYIWATRTTPYIFEPDEEFDGIKKKKPLKKK